METNTEGLTWKEWAAAAGIKNPYVPGYRTVFLREYYAWSQGEDPTEWRAEREQNQ